MTRIRGWLAITWVFGLVVSPVDGQQQARLSNVVNDLRDVEEQVTALEEAAEADIQESLIGMAAYREVLENGRYLVGPGDRFMLLMPGREAPIESVVTAGGGLLIPKVGKVLVAGLRLAEAQGAIEQACRQRLPGAEVTVEISALRTFPVSVSGLVREPGIRISSGVERVSEVIRKAGGLEDEGSQRDIRLIRGGRLRGEQRLRIDEYLQTGEVPEGLEVKRVDLAMYRATGATSYNPFVEDGDLIVVPAQAGDLLAREMWQRPGIYEYAPGDRMSDLSALALGPSPFYDPANVFLFRYIDGQQTPMRVDLAAALDGDEDADLELRPGDWLVPRRRSDYHQSSTVYLVGEIQLPGWYVIDDGGDPLSEVLARAGGLTPDASLTRARVVRDFDSEEEQDPELDRILVIPPAAWNREERQYYTMKMRERRGQMVVDFVELLGENGEGSIQDIMLRAGDAIIIPSSLETVIVSGQAANPGSIPYDETFTVADYIGRAGGLGWRASDEIVVIRARTGERRKADEIDRIEPGDRIWIKEKPERDYWKVFNESMSVAGQVATVMLLFVTVLR